METGTEGNTGHPIWICESCESEPATQQIAIQTKKAKRKIFIWVCKECARKLS